MWLQNVSPQPNWEYSGIWLQRLTKVDSGKGQLVSICTEEPTKNKLTN
jgi:hypothetical protein